MFISKAKVWIFSKIIFFFILKFLMTDYKNQSKNKIKLDYCSRCKVKTVEATCESCTTFNAFCQQCDASVHSLPSKKSHKRNFFIMNLNKQQQTNDSGKSKITLETRLNTNSSIKNKYENKNNTINLSQINKNDNTQQNSIENPFQSTISSSNPRNYININQNEFVNNNNNNYSQQNINNNQENMNINDENNYSRPSNSAIYVNNNYSREYINELKVINIIIVDYFRKRETTANI